MSRVELAAQLWFHPNTNSATVRAVQRDAPCALRRERRRLVRLVRHEAAALQEQRLRLEVAQRDGDLHLIRLGLDGVEGPHKVHVLAGRDGTLVGTLAAEHLEAIVGNGGLVDGGGVNGEGQRAGAAAVRGGSKRMAVRWSRCVD